MYYVGAKKYLGVFFVSFWAIHGSSALTLLFMTSFRSLKLGLGTIWGESDQTQVCCMQSNNPTHCKTTLAPNN